MLHVLLGAAIGAVLGAGTAAVRSLFGHEPIGWKTLVAGAVGGAAVGAVASLTCGGSLLAGSTVARVGGLTAAGALGGASEQTTDNLLHDRPWSEGVAREAATGAVVVGATGVVGRVAAKPARALARTRVVRGALAIGKRITGRVASVARGAWSRYLGALERRPILTKTITAGAIGGTGDVIAQKLQGKQELDLRRLAFMTASSMLWAAPGHYWFNALERWIPGTGAKALLGKLALERFLWTPPTTALTLGSKALYDGGGLDGAVQVIRRDFWKTYETNWLVWPAANVIAFRYIPLNLRIPFMNAVGLGWGVGLSSMMYGDEEPAAGAKPPARVVDLALGEEAPARPAPAPARPAAQAPQAHQVEARAPAPRAGITRALGGLGE